MKTQNVNAKLVFDKNSLTELNDELLSNVNGGSDIIILSITIAVVYAAGKMTLINQ